LAEMEEELSQAREGPSRALVAQTLEGATAIVAIQVLWQGRSTDETLKRIQPVWDVLSANREGLLQADGEGFYDGSGLILEELTPEEPVPAAEAGETPREAELAKRYKRWYYGSYGGLPLAVPFGYAAWYILCWLRDPGVSGPGYVVVPLGVPKEVLMAPACVLGLTSASWLTCSVIRRLLGDRWQEYMEFCRSFTNSPRWLLIVELWLIRVMTVIIAGVAVLAADHYAVLGPDEIFVNPFWGLGSKRYSYSNVDVITLAPGTCSIHFRDGAGWRASSGVEPTPREVADAVSKRSGIAIKEVHAPRVRRPVTTAAPADTPIFMWIILGIALVGVVALLVAKARRDMLKKRSGERLLAWLRGNPPASPQATVDAMLRLLRELPWEWQELPKADRWSHRHRWRRWLEKRQRRFDFDPNNYFVALDHLEMEEGYRLDYVVRFVGEGGPCLYARHTDQRPYSRPEEYWAKEHVRLVEGLMQDPLLLYDQDKACCLPHYNLNDRALATELTRGYMEHIHVDDALEGYFQFVVLWFMGHQFFLMGHSCYGSLEHVRIVCDHRALETLEAEDEGRFSQELMEQAKRLDLDPQVTLGEDNATVHVTVFHEPRGLYRWSFTIARDFPHMVRALSYTKVLECCGHVLFY